jgi:hypothetical protein
MKCVGVFFLNPPNVDGLPIFSAGVGFVVLTVVVMKCYLLGYNYM